MLRNKARAISAATVAVLLSLTMGAATSSAAKAPPSFFGVVPQTPLDDAQFSRMSDGNVGSVRVILNWGEIDPTPAAGDNNFAGIDSLMTDAANNGVDLLPFIYGTPEWVASGIDGYKCSGAKCFTFAPKKAAAIDAWETFVGEVVDRYGPDGAFWTEHPELPKNPIEVYQILNEMNSETFFAPKPNAKQYAKLLSAAADAIRSRDSSAQIVLGGLPELAGSHKAIIGSKYLADLYKVSGVKDDFDAIAPHPYGGTLPKVSSQVETYRKVMKKAHDSGADMYVTELGAGSAKGGSSLNRGEDGQADLVTDVYKYFIKKRNSFNVQQVDWFSWQDSKVSICDWCKTSGLITKSGKAKASFKAYTKLSGGKAG
jgi:hypothetical protein